MEVCDGFAVTLIKVGIKPVEKSVTSPIVLLSLSYEEQGFVHIALTFIDDTAMMIPRNGKKHLEIVYRLLTILLVDCNLLNINDYCAICEFVRKLRTICQQSEKVITVLLRRPCGTSRVSCRSFLLWISSLCSHLLAQIHNKNLR